MSLFTRLFKSQPGPVIDLDAIQAKARLDQKPHPFLLDVRQPEEFKEAHIAGANLIPLGELSGRLGELPSDQEIIVVCRSGSRSGMAVRQLRSAGYQALNLRGGLIGWNRNGLPLRSGGRR